MVILFVVSLIGCGKTPLKIDQAKVESLKAEIEKLRYDLKTTRDEITELRHEQDSPTTPLQRQLTVANSIIAALKLTQSETADLRAKENELQTLLKGSQPN